MLQKIQQREREHAALSKELGIFVNEESRANKLTSLTILELDKELRDEVHQLKKLKEERMVEVIELKSKDEEISAKVKMEPFFISTKTVPTDQKLEELKQHIRDMNVSVSRPLKLFSLFRHYPLSSCKTFLASHFPSTGVLDWELVAGGLHY